LRSFFEELRELCAAVLLILLLVSILSPDAGTVFTFTSFTFNSIVAVAVISTSIVAIFIVPSLVLLVLFLLSVCTFTSTFTSTFCCQLFHCDLLLLGRLRIACTVTYIQ
jgi:hypothetical protein